MQQEFDKMPQVQDESLDLRDSFPSNSASKLVEELQEFAVGHAPIALLIGAVSSGKTSLLKNLATRIKRKQSCQLVQGLVTLNLAAILHNFSAEDNSIMGQPLSNELLHSWMLKLPKNCLLIIDDADFLSMHTLELLISASSQQIGTRFRLLLAGKNTLQKRVNKVCLSMHKGYVPTYQLGPLSKQETFDYLTQLYKGSLRLKKKILSSKNSEKIFSLSGGYIGRISRVANNLSNGSAKSVFKKKKRRSLFDMILGVAIVSLLSLIGSRVFILANANTQYTQLDRQHAKMFRPAVMRSSKEVATEDNTSSFIASIENTPEELIPLNEPAGLELPMPPRSIAMSE
jgi:type II secretory pathway predicted ATPase ExeA